MTSPAKSMSLPFSAQYALFGAAKLLERNDEKGAWQILHNMLPPLLRNGQISEKQLKDIYKIMLEDLLSSSSEYVQSQKKITKWEDPAQVNHIKAKALEHLALDSSSSNIQSLLDEVLKSTDPSSAYSISIPLLGSSYAKNMKLYEDLKDKMFKALSLNLDDDADTIIKKLMSSPDWEKQGPFKIWMLGRILNASMNMGDKGVSEKMALVMNQLLQKSGNDPFSTWSRGYLSMYYAKEPTVFPKMQDEMIGSTNALAKAPGEKEKDNVHWAIVMNLQSISMANDRKAWDQQIKQLLDFTKTTSVLDALRTIPPQDFRSWAMSLLLLGAKRIGDNDTYSQIIEVIGKDIAESPSKGDQMLATEIANLAMSS